MARLLVGKIKTAHGVKGLVKVQPFCEDIYLLQGDLFTSETGEDTLHLTFKNAMKDHWLAEIKNISDRTQAETLRGTKLYIDESALPDLEDDEIYYKDLIGLNAVNESGAKIGKIIDVANFGAGDLLDIQPVQGGESFYVPYTNETVLDITKETIIISIPEGLLDAL